MYTDLAVDTLRAVGERLQTDLASNLAIPVFFEETQPENVGSEVLEIRLDGPFIREIANKQYIVTVEVDLLLTTPIYDNIYTRAQMLGICAEALRTDIPLLDGDNEQIGCLSTSIPFGGASKIETVNYGKVHKDRRLLHSAVSTTLFTLI